MPHVNTASAERTSETPVEGALPGGRDIFETSVSSLGCCGIEAGSVCATIPASRGPGGSGVLQSLPSGLSKDVSIPSGSLFGSLESGAAGSISIL